MARRRASEQARKPVPAWLLAQNWAERYDDAVAWCAEHGIGELTLIRYRRGLRLGDMAGQLDHDDRLEIATWELGAPMAETLPDPVRG